MSKYNELAHKVLETWPGTPEELGTALEDASDIPHDNDPYLSQSYKNEKAARRSIARGQIIACEGGIELLTLHEKERRYGK